MSPSFPSSPPLAAVPSIPDVRSPASTFSQVKARDDTKIVQHFRVESRILNRHARLYAFPSIILVNLLSLPTECRFTRKSLTLIDPVINFLHRSVLQVANWYISIERDVVLVHIYRRGWRLERSSRSEAGAAEGCFRW